MGGSCSRLRLFGDNTSEDQASLLAVASSETVEVTNDSVSSSASNADAEPLSGNSPNTAFSLLNLPPEILFLIFSHLSLQYLISVSKSCKPLNIRCADVRLLPAAKLVLHVVRGELAKAKALLELAKSNGLLRDLLCTKVTEVLSLTGLPVKNVTALQVAFRAGDFDTGEKEDGSPKNDGMVEMVLSYFPKLNDGEEEWKRQIREDSAGLEFIAEGENKGLLEAAPFDFSAIVDAIAKSDDKEIQAEIDDPDMSEVGKPPKEERTTDISKGLREFRKEFRETVQAESHFNPHHVLWALDFFDSEQYSNWSYAKQCLFSIQVFGYVQRYLPACKLQAFAQGVYYIVERGEFLKRDGKFRYKKDTSIISDGRVDDDLGFRYWATDMYLQWPGPSIIAMHPQVSRRGPTWRRFKNYVKQTHQKRADLLSKCDNTNPSPQLGTCR